MIATTQQADPIKRAARDSGLQLSRNGSWKLKSSGAAYHIRRTPAGFVQVERAAGKSATGEPLELHAEWPGPVKLVADARSTRARFEVRMGRQLKSGLSVDQESQSRIERLSGQLLQQGLAATNPDAGVSEGWSPPPPEYLVGRLTDAGYAVATDEEQNLRLTLKRKHCDGQVRIQCGSDRLRLSVVLGKWSATGLDDASIRAMLDLAGRFNDRTHLVRIAWYEPPVGDSGVPHASGNTANQQVGEAAEVAREEFRCEAQVDLSGLPFDESPNRVLHEFWGAMLVSSLAGLELAVRQLSLELEVLSDPKHREVLELLM